MNKIDYSHQIDESDQICKCTVCKQEYINIQTIKKEEEIRKKIVIEFRNDMNKKFLKKEILDSYVPSSNILIEEIINRSKFCDEIKFLIRIFEIKNQNNLLVPINRQIIFEKYSGNIINTTSWMFIKNKINPNLLFQPMAQTIEDIIEDSIWFHVNQYSLNNSKLKEKIMIEQQNKWKNLIENRKDTINVYEDYFASKNKQYEGL